jgi:hypothetical protein
MKDKNYMIISTDAKNIPQNSTFCHDKKKKTFNKFCAEGISFNPTKAIYQKPTDNNILTAKKLKVFSLRAGIR